MSVLHAAIACAALLFALLASACGDGDGDAGGGGATRTPADPAVTYAMKVEDAPIDELDLLIRESFPPQYSVKIVSGLPSGCHVFDRAEITGRSGNAITIHVTNLAPDDPEVVCTAIYGTKETFVDIGSDFVAGQDYEVRVNDKALPFTAQ